VNFEKFGRDVEFVAVRHHVGTAADGVNGHFIAAIDGEDGFQLGFEKAPMAGLGAGMQMMMGHEGAFSSLFVIAGQSALRRLRKLVCAPGNPSSLKKFILRREMDTRVKPEYDTEYEV
jgi:hypothetical protein